MNKEKWIRIVSAYSIIYTVITLLNSVLYLCTNLPIKLLLFRYVIAYIPSQLLVFAYVWFSGLREPLSKTAYRDIWINFTCLFILLCIVNAVISIYKNMVIKSGKYL